MEYTLKFEMPYLNCDNFKEKDLYNLMGVITGTRIGEYIEKYTYSNIRFVDSDKQKKYPIVSELENFTRSKTNCIIFDIKENNTNNKYKKLFVYQTLNRENPYYGIVGLKHDDTTVHIYFLDFDYSSLVINMFRMIQNNFKN